MAPIVLELPIPSADIAGNNRVHHMNRYKASRDATTDAKLVASTATFPPGGITPARLRIDWYGWTLPDWDNAIARCKPYIDGIVLAGIIPDDSPRHLVDIKLGDMKIDRKNRRVVLTIERVTDR